MVDDLDARGTAHALAIHAAGEPDCKQTRGWWAVDRSRGLAVPRNCKRWHCPTCRRFKRLVVLVALQHVFREAGHEVHALTLTDGRGDLDFASYYQAWNGTLRRWLQRSGYLHAYATALEVQPDSGRLHSHTLVVAPAGATGFIPHDELVEKAAQAGLGFPWVDHVTDIPGVETTLPGYFVTDKLGDFSITTQTAGRIGSYMAKAHDMQRLAGFAGERLRPWRASRNWPLNMGAASARLREELYGSEPGEWEIVHESHVRHWLAPMRKAQQRDARIVAMLRQLDFIDELRQLAA